MTYWARQLRMIHAKEAGEDVESPDSEHHQAWLELEEWDEVLAMAGPRGVPLDPRAPLPYGATCGHCGFSLRKRGGGEMRCFGPICWSCLREMEQRIARVEAEARAQMEPVKARGVA